jgi:hypothetical protein
MASNVLTKDEQRAKLEGQLEQLVVTTIRQNNAIERPEAIKLIAQLALKKATQRTRRKLVEPVAIATV